MKKDELEKYKKGEQAYATENEPSSMIRFDLSDTASFAIPYFTVLQVQWQNPAGEEFITLETSDREIFVIGESLRELYEEILRNVVSAIRVAPKASSTIYTAKVSTIEVEKRDTEQQQPANESVPLPPGHE